MAHPNHYSRDQWWKMIRSRVSVPAEGEPGYLHAMDVIERATDLCYETPGMCVFHAVAQTTGAKCFCQACAPGVRYC